MSVHDRFPHSTAELCRVNAVQFGVLSPDEIVRASNARAREAKARKSAGAGDLREGEAARANARRGRRRRASAH
jgi:DNA-directed RNA polymerase II subunit RPB1